MEPLTYLHIQMGLEGKEVVNGYSMQQVEAVPDEELPLVLVAQLSNAKLVVYYDQAIPTALQKELAASIAEIGFPELEPLLRVLKQHQVAFVFGHYKTYIFPILPSKAESVLCLSKHDPKVKAFKFDGFANKICAIERNGNLVSACVSTRENEMCGEAWVYTVPEYRLQGFAQKVVNAWARSLMDEGKIPFYSHKIENSVSAKLAWKLGLQPVFEEIAIIQR